MMVRLACSTVHKSLGKTYSVPTSITKNHFEQNSENINKILNSFYRQILDQICRWYPEEYEMLGLLANNDKQGYIALSEEFPELSNHLQWYGLVNSNSIAIPSMLEEIRRHVKNEDKKKNLQNQKVKTADLSIEEKRARIGHLRNSCEDRMKKLIKRSLKMKYGSENWGKSLIDHQKSYDKLKLQGISADDILGKRLYLKDIKSIFDNEWSSFQGIQNARKEIAVQKSEFLQFIDQLDQHRIDAHAGDMDDVSFGILIMIGSKVVKLLDELLAD